MMESVQTVAAKSNSFASGVHGVALYSIVAERLASRGLVNSAIVLLEPDWDFSQRLHGLFRHVSLDQMQFVVEEPEDSVGEGLFVMERRGDANGPAADLPSIVV